MTFGRDRPSQREVRHRWRVAGILAASTAIGLVAGGFVTKAATVLSYLNEIGLDGRSAATWFADGVFVAFAVSVGCAIAWAAWWLRSRRPC